MVNGRVVFQNHRIVRIAGGAAVQVQHGQMALQRVGVTDHAVDVDFDVAFQGLLRAGGNVQPAVDLQDGGGACCIRGGDGGHAVDGADNAVAGYFDHVGAMNFHAVPVQQQLALRADQQVRSVDDDFLKSGQGFLRGAAGIAGAAGNDFFHNGFPPCFLVLSG